MNDEHIHHRGHRVHREVNGKSRGDPGLFGLSVCWYSVPSVSSVVKVVSLAAAFLRVSAATR